jgi:hypothetical protein
MGNRGQQDPRPCAERTYPVRWVMNLLEAAPMAGPGKPIDVAFGRFMD